LIDPALAAATVATAPKSGYFFTYAAGAGNVSFTVLATPAQAGQSGDMNYFTDNSGVIRSNAAGAAGPSSPALQ
jgi:hypothetical protein